MPEPGYYKNDFYFLSHLSLFLLLTHTHTPLLLHTPTLSHSLFLLGTHSFSHTHSLLLLHTHARSYSRVTPTLSLLHTHTLTLTQTIECFLVHFGKTELRSNLHVPMLSSHTHIHSLVTKGSFKVFNYFNSHCSPFNEYLNDYLKFPQKMSSIQISRVSRIENFPALKIQFDFPQLLFRTLLVSVTMSSVKPQPIVGLLFDGFW